VAAGRAASRIEALSKNRPTMKKIPCTFCGLPVRVGSDPSEEPVYCCSGCALAAQIPMDGGYLPISRQLIVSLTLAFAYFNQFLFWSLAFALRGEGRDLLADRFEWITLALGALVLIGTLIVFFRASVHRWTDWLVMALIGLSVVFAVVSGSRIGLTPAVAWVLGTNTLMLILLSRGFLKRLLRNRR